jgi:hypothetical protein
MLRMTTLAEPDDEHALQRERAPRQQFAGAVNT